ncbi:hypothetical protein LGH70_02250 [Hymenobacter sp. BT635]|uniref:Uncharacterized protein n=1 Tax=Hymenobacter nitidus TaxID=2880929 RepID=A0ABS8AAE4_9BACT|nr:hypothetical protein [Hymenobacter nitidus]MCB2376384.1 hypothetical protein [Hymenobacter nitidus]
MKNRIMWDAYDRKARVYPAFFVLIPVLTLHYLYLEKEFSEWNTLLTALKSITIISFPLLLLYFTIEQSRFIGKAIFENWYFKGNLFMPTTNFLLHSTKHLSSTYKREIRKKIKTDFSLSLSSNDQEQTDGLEARRKISEAVALIREKVRGENFVLKYNIHYGIARNLAGGSVIALATSIVDYIIFKYVETQQFAAVLSILLIIVYSSLLLSSKFVMVYLGNNYAERLYTEYMK